MANSSQNKSCCLVRIYFNEDNIYEGQPLVDYLMGEVQKAGLHGATVFRGIMGFGSHQIVHSTTLLRWTESLPLILEIMDSEESLKELLQKLKPSLADCLIIKIPVEQLIPVAE
jgi:uncharacterized protein